MLEGGDHDIGSYGAFEEFHNKYNKHYKDDKGTGLFQITLVFFYS